MEFDHRKIQTSRKNFANYKNHLKRHGKFVVPLPPISPPLPIPPNPILPPPPVHDYPILPPPLVPDSLNQNHVSKTSMTIMACVFGGALLFGFLCIVARLHYIRQRNSRSRSLPVFFGTQEDFLDEDQGPETNHPIWYINFIGLQQSVIDSITVFKYKKDEGLIDGTECSVCLGEFQEDESLRLLPKCSHAFHIPCIDTWLGSHKNCPLCRAPIVSDNFVAQVALPLPTTSDLSSREEPQMENSETSTPGGLISSNQAGEDGSSEVRNGEENICGLQIVDESNGLNSNHSITRNPRIRSDLVDNKLVVGDEEMQPMRRSVSLDFSTASAIYSVVANVVPGKCQANSDSLLVLPKQPKSKKLAKRGSSGNLNFHKLMKNSSAGRSLQKGPISMKRSLSTSGKSMSSRSSRGQNPIHSF